MGDLALVHDVARIFGLKNHFVVFFGRQVVEIIIDRILRLTSETHLIMKMRAG